MTERRALIATTVANLVMAVAAVGSLIVSVGTIRVMVNDQRARDAQFREERAGWKLALDEERQERRVAARAARSPFLSISQCCNPTAIIFAKSPEPNRPFIDLPFTEEEKKNFPTGYNRGFVARLVNLGPGSATKVKAVWHPEKMIDVDGVEHAPEPEPEYGNRFFRVHTWPNHITAHGEAEIRHFPSCVYSDRQMAIAWVEGYIELSCEDMAGEIHRFRYNFTIEPFYHAEKNNDKVASISVHIEGNRDLDGPFPHTVARPLQ